ncbi:MAG: hypothetical protein WBA17_08860 [Saprospiraceae bacterium]
MYRILEGEWLIKSVTEPDLLPIAAYVFGISFLLSIPNFLLLLWISRVVNRQKYTFKKTRFLLAFAALALTFLLFTMLWIIIFYCSEDILTIYHSLWVGYGLPSVIYFFTWFRQPKTNTRLTRDILDHFN